MLRVIILSALTVVSLAKMTRIDMSLDKDWEMWQSFHNKAYNDKYEELERREIWEDNFKMINKHNLEYSLGIHTYTLGMNEFGDIRHEEFLVRNGYKQSKKSMKKGGILFDHEEVALKVDVPDSIDWRDQGYVTPVKDQGQCGSCWSFSATGSLEGQYFRAAGLLDSFSEQQLVDCSTPYGDYGCNGGLMDDAFKYIESHKIEQETDYPYHAQDETCHYEADKGVTEVSNYQDIEEGSEDALKVAVGSQGPISVAIDASHQSFQFYQSGVYSEPYCSSTQLDHGVLVVGYGTDSDSGSDYWLVKNSWGTSWGLSGYIMMSRNKENQCGIATSASYPIVKKPQN